MEPGAGCNRWPPIRHDAFIEYRMGDALLSKTGFAANGRSA